MEFLERQKQDLTAQLDGLVSQISPALRAAYGVGPDTAAQLRVTAGINPHRLRRFDPLVDIVSRPTPVAATQPHVMRARRIDSALPIGSPVVEGGDRNAGQIVNLLSREHLTTIDGGGVGHRYSQNVEG
jgi:hypothetical protein